VDNKYFNSNSDVNPTPYTPPQIAVVDDSWKRGVLANTLYEQPLLVPETSVLECGDFKCC